MATRNLFRSSGRVARGLCSSAARGNLRIGDVLVQVGAPPSKPSLVPSPAAFRNAPHVDSDASLGTVQWLCKKAALRQDAILLGSHPAYLRRLVFRYAELAEREAEFVSISRDTTESDLKQRRELSAGSVLYVNQPVVEAAVHGRLLVIEGLEKAERNLLPLINNLLENREMALEDGSLLIHPDRYDSLRRGGMSDAELASRRLLRVSPHFMVVAIGMPVPRFPGTALDPPLRSRFQARAVVAPPAAQRKTALAALLPAAAEGAGTPLARAVDALDALEAVHALRAGAGGGGTGGGGLSDFVLPTAPALSLTSIANLCAAFPADGSVASFLPRVLPHAPTSSELSALLSKFELSSVSPGGGTAHGWEPARVRTADETEAQAGVGAMLHADNRLGIIEWQNAAADGNTLLPIPLACGHLGVGGGPAMALEHGALADLPAQADVCAALLQDHSIDVDMCLLGPKGSGKTSIARRFAATLGYSPRTIYCYADLPARDLLMRRATDDAGSTIWEDAEAVRAAICGDLLVVDNIHRLPQGTFAATLGRLITDRELQLPDGRRLLPQAKVDEMRESGVASSEELAQLVPVHPAFRIVATGETPNAWRGDGADGGGGNAMSGGWLGSELAGLFHFHHVPSLTINDHSALITATQRRLALMHAASAPDPAAAASALFAQADSHSAIADTVCGKLLALHEALDSEGKAAALQGLSLTTRGLLRAASHAHATTAAHASGATASLSLAEESASLSVRAEIAHLHTSPNFLTDSLRVDLLLLPRRCAARLSAHVDSLRMAPNWLSRPL